MHKPLRRSVRQLLSVVALAALLLTFFAGALGREFAWLALLPPIPLIFLIMWLDGATAKIATKKVSKLDERQRGVQARAHRLTYWVLFLYASLVLFVYGFGFGDLYIPNAIGVWEVPLISQLLEMNVFLFIVLPILFVAWLEPNPPAETSDSSLQGENACN